MLPAPSRLVLVQVICIPTCPVQLRPVQCLDSIPASTTEQEQGVGEWIQMKLLLNHGRQSVNSASQVGVAAGDVDLVRSRKIAYAAAKLHLDRPSPTP